MTGAPQLTFDDALGIPALPTLAGPLGSAPYIPPPLIGEAEVKRLQGEGWQFDSGGIKLGNCWSCWAALGEQRKVYFLADPDLYPEAWSQEPNEKS